MDNNTPETDCFLRKLEAWITKTVLLESQVTKKCPLRNKCK